MPVLAERAPDCSAPAPAAADADASPLGGLAYEACGSVNEFYVMDERGLRATRPEGGRGERCGQEGVARAVARSVRLNPLSHHILLHPLHFFNAPATSLGRKGKGWPVQAGGWEPSWAMVSGFSGRFECVRGPWTGAPDSIK